MSFSHDVEIVGTVLFFLAVLHTFFVKKIADLSDYFPKESLWNSFFHLMGELEIVFGLWAALLMLFLIVMMGNPSMIHYQQSLNFTEPLFVFCVMTICATRPVLTAARTSLMLLSQLVQKVTRVSPQYADIFVVLFIGPLSGSFITEPAAMTVSALMLNSMIKNRDSDSSDDNQYNKNAHYKILYFMIATLFVNISIGGAMTTYAAPPILMVAAKWNWSSFYVFSHLGWKSIVATGINSLVFIFVFRKKLIKGFYSFEQVADRLSSGQASIPIGVMMTHLFFLASVVAYSHYVHVFMGIFLLFLGVTVMTKRYQDTIRIRESLLVAFFLGGIVVFGAFQKWWLEPIFQNLSDQFLFLSATLLTTVTDNAALTYLGSQVAGLSESSRLALVAGALCGGGMTVIANAPNPAGYSILSHKFENSVINPLLLFLYAVPPTLVACFCIWWL